MKQKHESSFTDQDVTQQTKVSQSLVNGRGIKYKEELNLTPRFVSLLWTAEEMKTVG